MTDSLDERLDAIFEAVLDYEDARTEQLVREELAQGTDLHVILNWFTELERLAPTR